jgi:hypothetical protein
MRLAAKVAEVALVLLSDEAKKFVVVPLVPWMVVEKSDVEVAFVVVEFRPVKFWSVEDAKEMKPPQNCEATDEEVAVRYATVGDVDDVMVVPSEESQPWPKEVCPVPPLETARVPLMLASVVVATQVGTPSRYARTKPAVPTEVVLILPALLPYTRAPDWMEAQPVPPLVTGRTPVTSVVRATDAQVATPAPLMERTNWLVQAVVPWYADATPDALVVMSDEAIEVTARLVVVAFVVVALEMKLLDAVSVVPRRLVAKPLVLVALVDWSVVAKSVVEVALVS